MSMAWTLAVLAVIAVSIADILSTRRFLDLGTREANPIWRWAQSRLGRWWWVPKLAATLGITAVAWWHGAILVPWIMSVGLAGVVIWNLRQIRRARP